MLQVHAWPEEQKNGQSQSYRGMVTSWHTIWSSKTHVGSLKNFTPLIAKNFDLLEESHLELEKS
jgi:hypothetical protein